MTHILSPEIDHRDEFSLLCNWRKLYTAVEVGIDRAEFSIQFLEKWRGHRWHGVDSWGSYDDMPWDRTADFNIASIRIERHACRARLVRMQSLDAAKAMGNARFGFIYLDGSHDEQSVINDVTAWFPLLESNGILAGHDFDDTHPGVIDAVTWFVNKNKLQLYLTSDKPLVSWYVYKNGMPGMNWRRCP